MQKQKIMDQLFSNIKIVVPEGIYLKDPESSDLGRRIVENSIVLIEEIGFEAFTFKKLGMRIGSNESSIYRYFESKHKLLVYLSSWYWGWLEYQLVIETHSIADPKRKLIKALEVISRKVEEDSNFTHVNEVLLHRIMINESSKSYLTKEVDQENKEGYFEHFKRLVSRLEDIIKNLNPEYKYSKSLASTIIEGALHEHFLMEHFPSLTNCNQKISPFHFYSDMSIKILNS